MIRLAKSMFMVLALVFLFVLNVQAQVEDTTSNPAGSDYGKPNTDSTEMESQPGMGNQSTQIDTAAHFKLAQEMTERLSQTLNLTEEQENKIIERIVEFEENVADVNMEQREGESNSDTQEDLNAELVSLVDDIEAMLDDTQRAQWIKMKNDWMTEVKANIQSDQDVKSQDQRAE